MKTKITILFILFVNLWGNILYADSPITSTPFSNAYVDHHIIIAASEAKGLLNEQLIEYILRVDVRVDTKMAVINKLSWLYEGKTNSLIYMDYLIKNGLYDSEKDFRTKASGDELLAMAYLLAMDNYFNVHKAVEYADLAIIHNPNSMTYFMIEALIKAQHGIWKNWCNIYERYDEDFVWDMEYEAVRIIYRYMNLYRGKVTDC